LPAVEKSLAERDGNYKKLREALQQLAEARGELMVGAVLPNTDGVRVIAEVLSGAPQDFLLLLATAIAKREKTVVLLIAEETGQLVFAQHASAGKNFQDALKKVTAEYPGKGGGTKDFVRAKLADAAQSTAALDLAKSLIGG